jgi:hypothetical protein
MFLARDQADDQARARSLAEPAETPRRGRTGWDWIERDASEVLDALG